MQDLGENFMIFGAFIESFFFIWLLLCARGTEMNKTSKYFALVKFTFW